MPNILIVCTANICRSPMAMVLLQQMLIEHGVANSWQVESAGTWARDGFAASENGRILMAERGLDLSSHRSRVVDDEMIARSDLVLTMEKGQAEAIRVEFPEAAGRVHLLSEMIGVPVDIQDPYGGTLEEYRETAEELDAYITGGFEKILSLARSSR